MLLPPGNRRVAVIIPCLNESEPIGGVVGDVLAQGVDRVIVVDNGSTDDTAERAAAAGAADVPAPQGGFGRGRAPGVPGPPPEARTQSLFCGGSTRVTP